MIRYKLAEKLSERLDEMGKDLISMIEEVNGASSTLSKTSKANEPVRPLPLPYYTYSSRTDDIDLPNRPHPQLAPIPTATHRHEHNRAPGQGQRGAKSRPVAFVAVRAWIQQLWYGW